MWRCSLLLLAVIATATAEVESLDTGTLNSVALSQSEAVALDRGRGRGRGSLRSSSSFSVGRSSNRAGNDEELELGESASSGQPVPPWKSELKELQAEVGFWRTKAQAVVEEIERRGCNHPKENLAGVRKQKQSGREQRSQGNREKSNSIKMPPSTHSKAIKRKSGDGETAPPPTPPTPPTPGGAEGPPNLDGGYNAFPDDPAELDKLYDIPSLPLKTGGFVKGRGFEWVAIEGFRSMTSKGANPKCTKPGYRYAKDTNQNPTAGDPLYMSEDHCLKPTKAPQTVYRGECVDNEKDGMTECEEGCFDGWHSIVTTGNSGVRNAVNSLANNIFQLLARFGKFFTCFCNEESDGFKDETHGLQGDSCKESLKLISDKILSAFDHMVKSPIKFPFKIPDLPLIPPRIKSLLGLEEEELGERQKFGAITKRVKKVGRGARKIGRGARKIGKRIGSHVGNYGKKLLNQIKDLKGFAGNTYKAFSGLLSNLKGFPRSLISMFLQIIVKAIFVMLKPKFAPKIERMIDENSNICIAHDGLLYRLGETLSHDRTFTSHSDHACSKESIEPGACGKFDEECCSAGNKDSMKLYYPSFEGREWYSMSDRRHSNWPGGTGKSRILKYADISFPQEPPTPEQREDKSYTNNGEVNHDTGWGYDRAAHPMVDLAEVADELKPGTPLGNAAGFNLKQYLTTPKTEDKMCEYSISAVMTACNTCCCKEGYVKLPILSDLVKGNQFESCRSWFLVVDAVSRVGFATLRAGYMAKYYTKCESKVKRDWLKDVGSKWKTFTPNMHLNAFKP